MNLPRPSNSKAIFAHGGRGRISAIVRMHDGGAELREIRSLQDLKGQWRLLALALVAGLSLCGGALWLDSGSIGPHSLVPLAIPAAVIASIYMTRIVMAGVVIAILSGVVAISQPRFGYLPSVLVGLGLWVSVLGIRSRQIWAEKCQVQVTKAETEVDRIRALVNSFESNAKDWLWQTNSQGYLDYISPSFVKLIRPVSEDDKLGLVDWLRIKYNRTAEQRSALRVIQFNIAAGLPFNEVALPITTDDGERWLSISGAPVLSSDGAVIGYSGLACDLTEVRRSEAEVRQLARFDSLTGLANRAYFRDTLEQVLGQSNSSGAPCALLFIDLDRFKAVNDTLGHGIGDALLKSVADRLEFVLQQKGRVGRLGGDEFVAIIVDARDRKAIAALAARMIKEISTPYTINDTQIVIGASVGVAFGPHDGRSAEQLMRNADFALYAAKENGRGTHRFYDANMRKQIEKRQTLETELRRALVADQLVLVYQPIVDATTERLTGFEALIRWDHPTLGSISPDMFIPLAEEANLIGRIGEWVVRTACMEAADWPEEIRIAVNLSPSQFVDANLPGMVLNALAASGLTPGRLELELTEGVFLNENNVTASTLAALNGMGVHLAMDDFGTGYSSLGYLRRASFSKIKIDRSFVRGVAGRNRDNVEIVRAVVTIAKSLGMITTAEGAETAEEVQALRELGCTQIQGFFYGEPMEVDKARALIATSSDAPHKRDLTPRKTRIQMLRAADLKVGRKTYQVLVKNLSAEGAMIQIEASIKAGTKVLLELPGFEAVLGVVRWTQPNKIGIAFDQCVDLNNLRQMSWMRERRALDRSRNHAEREAAVKVREA